MKLSKPLYFFGVLILSVLLCVSGFAFAGGYRNLDALQTGEIKDQRSFWERFLEDFDWNNFPWDTFPFDNYDDFPWQDLPWDEMPTDFDWGNLPWQDLTEDFPWENVPFGDPPENFPWDEIPWDAVPEGDIDWSKVPMDNMPWDELPEDFDWADVPWENASDEFDWANVPWNDLPEDFDWSSVPWDKVDFSSMPEDFPWWEKVPWTELGPDFPWENLPWETMPPAALAALWVVIPPEAIPEGVTPEGFIPEHDHVPDLLTGWKVEREATCGTPGFRTSFCAICKARMSQIIRPTGAHELDEDKYCHVCGLYMLAVTSKSLAARYDGGAIRCEEYEVDPENTSPRLGREGHEIRVGGFPSLGVQGRLPNTFTVTVVDAAGNDVTSQYYVIKTYGTLEMTKRTIAIVTPDIVRVYEEGATYPCGEDEDNKVRVEGDGLAEGDRLVILAWADGLTDYGRTSNAFTEFRIENAAGEDVTENYVIATRFGKLSVTGG